MAISAVDVALWDLKARLLDVALVTLLGAVRDAVPVYDSGGFTSYCLQHLQAQLDGWVEQGIPRVKMKIGTHPGEDLGRVRAAREAIGPEAALYMDANGAYSRKYALAQAEAFRDSGVVWFEEPVPSDDLDGLHLLRDRAPAGMDIAAGEYGYDLGYFRLPSWSAQAAGETPMPVGGTGRIISLEAHGLPTERSDSGCFNRSWCPWMGQSWRSGRCPVPSGWAWPPVPVYTSSTWSSSRPP